MFGLYLHVPYCMAKCHYCDFNSRPPLSGERFDPYVDALCLDIERQTPRTIDTVFVGGGTPSLLSGSQIGRIMQTVRQHFELAPAAEVTLEANPGTIERHSWEAIRASGVNRVSLGAQARQPHLLQRLGRQHDWQQVVDAVQWARQAGFERLNLDLMYGLPGQTVADWEASLQGCLDLQPDHLSTYSLIVEEDTAFGREARRGTLVLPDEGEEEAMWQATLQHCQAAGLRAYEVSNWARPGQECRHNLLYWNNDPYLGLGAGAVSYLDGWRWTRVRRPDLYIERVQADGELFEGGERVSDVVSWHETVTLGLRRFDGLDLAAVERRHGVPSGWLEATWKADFAAEAAQGLVAFDMGRMRLGWHGMRLASSFGVRVMAYSLPIE